jgi:hypothetical protein
MVRDKTVRQFKKAGDFARAMFLILQEAYYAKPALFA